MSSVIFEVWNTLNLGDYLSGDPPYLNTVGIIAIYIVLYLFFINNKINPSEQLCCTTIHTLCTICLVSKGKLILKERKIKKKRKLVIINNMYLCWLNMDLLQENIRVIFKSDNLGNNYLASMKY